VIGGTAHHAAADRARGARGAALERRRQPWDNHDGLAANHKKLADQWDQPIAAFLADLKARGLFDSTLVQGAANSAAPRWRSCPR